MSGTKGHDLIIGEKCTRSELNRLGQCSGMSPEDRAYPDLPNTVPQRKRAARIHPWSRLRDGPENKVDVRPFAGSERLHVRVNKTHLTPVEQFLAAWEP